MEAGQIAETVLKVVRELGHPALAGVYSAYAAAESSGLHVASPPAVAPRPVKPPAPELVLRFPAEDAFAAVTRECARQFTLHRVYTREVAAVHADGLLTLTGLTAPDELESSVTDLKRVSETGTGLLALLGEARRFTAGRLVLDGPEHLSQAPDSLVREFGRGVAPGGPARGRQPERQRPLLGRPRSGTTLRRPGPDHGHRPRRNPWPARF